MKGLLNSLFFHVATIATLLFFGIAEDTSPGIGVGTDVMQVTGEPGSSIDEVTLKGDNGKDYFFLGCGSDECTYDISHVAVGCYIGTVVTDTGIITDFDCVH
ncbi:MAG: hypothetical protein ACI94Y_003596 [Maribacter sp.]|jgi:hypothetical protein